MKEISHLKGAILKVNTQSSAAEDRLFIQRRKNKHWGENSTENPGTRPPGGDLNISASLCGNVSFSVQSLKLWDVC